MKEEMAVPRSSVCFALVQMLNAVSFYFLLKNVEKGQVIFPDH